jgi:hypothetical protein
VDPIRDGNNWFSYVNNDAINWIDRWGLNASDNTLQTQVTLLDSGYDKARAENACVALTLMDAAQDFIGTTLNQNQVTSLLDSFYEKSLCCWQCSV